MCQEIAFSVEFSIAGCCYPDADAYCWLYLGSNALDHKFNFS